MTSQPKSKTPQPKPNSTPHYIVAKINFDDNNKIDSFKDISDYVSGVSFSSSLGQFPKTKLDITPSEDVKYGNQADGVLLSIKGTIKITRNDRIMIAETDEDGYNKFIGKEEGSEPEIPEAIVIMLGVVSDMMSSWTGTSAAVSVTVDDELSKLDTTLATEVLGSRGSGLTAATLLPNDTEYHSGNKGEEEEEEEQGTVESMMVRSFIEEFSLNEPIEFDESMFKSLGNGFSPLPISEDERMVVQDIGDTNRLKIDPWRLVRLVMCHCLVKSFPSSENAAEEYGIDLKSSKETIENLIGLMFQIEAQEGENQNTIITLSRNEYGSFLKSMVIKPMVSAGANSTSLWTLINSIMNSLHFYFTPKVLFHSSRVGSANLGSFKMMNPYREYTTKFKQDAIEAYETSIPGYKSIIKSIGFKANPIIPTLLKNVTKSLTNIYMVYKAKPEDLVLFGTKHSEYVRDLGNVPEYAYHKKINFPLWLPPAIGKIRALYSDTKKTQDQSSENAHAAMIKTSEVEDQNNLAYTLRAFLRSALMIYGRINVTANLRLIRLWSDCLEPLRVVLVESGNQTTTGLVSGVSVKWKQGVSYTVSVNLSNVTDIYDPYFRALNNDLGVTKKDNLEKYLEDEE